MMSKHSMNGRNQHTMISLEELVPDNHLTRKIDKVIDFTFIYSIVGSTYPTLVRSNIDPVVLVKIVFIQSLFGIRSMRK